jgi:hypothetical protein
VKDGDVSYANYSIEELRQALASIDARKYPRNYANLKDAMAARAKLPPVEVEKLHEDLVSGEAPVKPAKPAKPARPVTTSDLGSALGISFLLLAYALDGLLSKGSVDLPVRGNWHLEGGELYFFVTFLVVAVACNAVRLASWMREPTTEAPLYKNAKTVGLVALVFFIVFVIFHAFR